MCVGAVVKFTHMKSCSQRAPGSLIEVTLDFLSSSNVRAQEDQGCFLDQTALAESLTGTVPSSQLKGTQQNQLHCHKKLPAPFSAFVLQF